jgi:RNA polymerase sigma factor (sigma-70 family)
MMDTPGNAERFEVNPSREADEALREHLRHLNELLLRVQRGDQQAFADLYQATSSRIFGVIHRMLHNRSEAEDILQDVYLAAWRRADTFDPARGNALTWLITLGRNRTIDRMREHREEPLDEDAPDIEDEAPTPAAVAELSEERMRLERCLQLLEPQQGRAVREAFFTGVTYSELAERLSVPLGTMKSWIRRSLMQLKLCLER